MTRNNRLTANPAVGLMVLLLVCLLMITAASVALTAIFGADASQWGYGATAAILVVNSLVFGLAAVACRPLITGSLRSTTPSRMKGGIYLSVLIIALLIQPLTECATVANYAICQSSLIHPLVGEPSHASDAVLATILRFDSVWQWTVAIVVVAILPAICEEMFFRWAMLPAARRMTGNWHAAILTTAIFFAIVHGDVYGILPRALLGGVMGVLFFITHDLRAPIAFHIANNALVVITVGTSGMTAEECMAAEPESPNVFASLISTLVAFGELYCVDLVCRNPKKVEEILNGTAGDND